jgi:hypothetical protein
MMDHFRMEHVKMNISGTLKVQNVVCALIAVTMFLNVDQPQTLCAQQRIKLL